MLGVGEATISPKHKKKTVLFSLQANNYTAGLQRERTSKYPVIEQSR
jgi:hypothetical protein